MIVRIWGSPLRVKKIGNNRSPNFHKQIVSKSWYSVTEKWMTFEGTFFNKLNNHNILL